MSGLQAGISAVQAACRFDIEEYWENVVKHVLCDHMAGYVRRVQLRQEDACRGQHAEDIDIGGLANLFGSPPSSAMVAASTCW